MAALVSRLSLVVERARSVGSTRLRFTQELLQEAGYGRGKIDILDVENLREVACEKAQAESNETMRVPIARATSLARGRCHVARRGWPLSSNGKTPTWYARGQAARSIETKSDWPSQPRYIECPCTPCAAS